ncbi:hypothetical protein PR003_g10650 [Phytophthora rubi]|uniref:Uncharacterized protein n=1 Tax=Phytophthora rubi TaxID=129364 RepID=A0A6A3I2I9_9STRA|nr:hypothetical protein PR002_g25954 [Phytophthora rubi]KAE8975388.1 hypothetical protein PR001_g25719 [Phytophthora rubi]KAE9340151.1 hypothetical protein PR003_g10650 [Phytophthora rubi]
MVPPPMKKKRRTGTLAKVSSQRQSSESGPKTKTTKPTRTSKKNSKSQRINSKKKAAKKSSSRNSAEPTRPMRWTVALTALALETRFKNPHIVKKFAARKADTKLMRAKWEATVHTFLEQALIENAWCEGESPREVTIDQFKNKINDVRTGYRAKRSRLLATGNAASTSASESEDEAEQREYPEMPCNFFLYSSRGIENVSENLTCDPMDVDPKYRDTLGKELTTLWPLLCDVLSGKPGCTGEAIVESGLLSREQVESDCEDVNGEDSVDSDAECSDASSQARSEAKANAKSTSNNNRRSSNRSVDVIADSLHAGFGSIERILTARQAPVPDRSSGASINQLVAKLASTIDAATSSQALFLATQQEASESLRQSAMSLQQMAASATELFVEMKQQLRRGSE